METVTGLTKVIEVVLEMDVTIVQIIEIQGEEEEDNSKVEIDLARNKQ